MQNLSRFVYLIQSGKFAVVYAKMQTTRLSVSSLANIHIQDLNLMKSDVNLHCKCIFKHLSSMQKHETQIFKTIKKT